MNHQAPSVARGFFSRLLVKPSKSVVSGAGQPGPFLGTICPCPPDIIAKPERPSAKPRRGLPLGREREARAASFPADPAAARSRHSRVRALPCPDLLKASVTKLCNKWSGCSKKTQGNKCFIRSSRNPFLGITCPSPPDIIAERRADRADRSAGRQALRSSGTYFVFKPPPAGLMRMRIWPPSIFSTSKAPVLRTRSLSLLWP